MKSFFNRIFTTISNKNLTYMFLAIIGMSIGISFIMFSLSLVGFSKFQYHLQPKYDLEYTIAELRKYGSEIEDIYGDTLQRKDINWFKGVYSNENLELAFIYRVDDEVFTLYELVDKNSGKNVSGWSERNWFVDWRQNFFPIFFWNSSVSTHNISPIQLYKFQKDVYSNVITVINPAGLMCGFFIDTFFVDYYYIISYYMMYGMNISLFVIILLFIIYNGLKCFNLIISYHTPYHLVILKLFKKCCGRANIAILLILFFMFVGSIYNDGNCIYRYTYMGNFEELSSKLQILGLKSSPGDKSTDTNLITQSDSLILESESRYSYIGGWYSVDDFAVKVMIDANNSGVLILNKYINLKSNKESNSWFYKILPHTNEYNISPFKLLKLQYILNRDLISKTDFDYYTLVNTSEFIVGNIVYFVLYYRYIIFPLWILLFLSSFIYRYRKNLQLYPLRKFIPKIIKKNFQIVTLSENDKRIDIWIDECMKTSRYNNLYAQNIEYIGFMKEQIIQEHSIKSKKIYYHIRRREYLYIPNGELFTKRYHPSKKDMQRSPKLVSLLTYNNSQPPVPS